MQLVLQATSVAGIREWPESAGFDLDVLTTGGASQNATTEIYLQLTDGRYRDVFLALCEDVCSVLAKATGEAAAVRDFHSRLVRWQSFLKLNRPEGLSPEAQVGLFGELRVMADILLERMDHSAVVRAWRGCRKAAQDYQFNTWAMEVKTSRAPILDRIAVSNVQQLDEDGKSPLFLTVVQVHANPTSGETLPQLVERVRGRVDFECLELLDSGLVEVGYLETQAHLYAETKYDLIQVLHHEVRDGFPRIRRNDLPDGVKKVRYDISIDAARGFRVGEEAVYRTPEGAADDTGD
jgi:hypothetical protein